MSKRIRYSDEPMGEPKVVPDFLPRPEDLVFKEDGVKVTIFLSRRSVEFFKDQARKHNTQYQRMIRRLLDAYAEHHAGGATLNEPAGRYKVASRRPRQPQRA
jgi:hypothetical protein